MDKANNKPIKNTEEKKKEKTFRQKVTDMLLGQIEIAKLKRKEYIKYYGCFGHPLRRKTITKLVKPKKKVDPNVKN